MINRRSFFVSTAFGLGAGSLAHTTSAASFQNPSNHDKTWLTYAVNVEMFWSKLPFLDRLKQTAEAGFTHYEFWPWRNKDVDAIKRVNDELGLVPVQFTASPKKFSEGITDPARKAEFLDDVKAAIPIAKTLGVKLLTVVAGEETAGYSRAQQTQAVIDTFKAAAPLVADADITLILEPLNILVDHPKQLVVTSAHAAEILQSVNSPHVKMLFDIYHQQISEGNLSNNIRKYKDLIGYFQLADHPGRFEPGTGEINYAHVLKVVHDTGYKGVIGLEMRPKGEPIQALKSLRDVDNAAKHLADVH